VTTLTVSVHDVAPSTADATRRWVADLDARGIPTTLLVVPGPWSTPALAGDPSLSTWLREAVVAGHEVALHGWTHRADVRHRNPVRRLIGDVVARGAAEFWSLDHDEARRRLRLGLDAMEAEGLEPTGFTPPGWLASPATRAALVEVGLRYTTSHLAVTDLVTGRRRWIPVVCHRPGGRGERAGARLMVRTAAVRARRGRPVRIALHPADRDRPGLREAALEAIDLALAAGAVPVTYATMVGDPVTLPGPGRPTD